MRFFRLAFGVFFLIEGFRSKDWAMGIVGGWFLYQAVTNTGCCGTTACAAPPVRQSKNAGKQKIETIEYTEI